MEDAFPFRTLKNRLRDMLLAELEGFLNTDSIEEMTMFEQLFGELLAEEKVTLSRIERQRLYDAVLAEIVELTRR